jgi:hypothetical protein
MNGPTALELDGRIRDIIDQGRALFPGVDFREGEMFYSHGEWALALDAVFFALKALNKEVPIDLYEKIVGAAERMKLGDVSHWYPIKPKKE